MLLGPREVYLDHNATTPVSREARIAMASAALTLRVAITRCDRNSDNLQLTQAEFCGIMVL